MDNSIIVSTPPHVKTKRTTRDIMLDVVIAMLPCAIAGVVFFGWQALCIILMSVFACVATEFVYFFIANKGFSQKCKKAGEVCRRWARQFDLTSVVTGLILALIIPVTDKWYEVLYEVIIGGIIAIAVVKMMFGGTGKNLVNPAALARVFMFLSFTLTVYTACKVDAILPSAIPLKDGTVVTGATNINGILTLSKGKDPASYLSNLYLFLGTGVPGCIGETSKAAILLGYIYLVVRKVLKWWQPLLFLGVFGICAVLLAGFTFDSYTLDISLFLPSILSGGAVFGGVFMLTDYVTSPKGGLGQLIYYAGAGVLLAVLRHVTQMEVISFVILIMNLLVPLIDKYAIKKPFGYSKAKAGKEGK